MHLGSGIAVAVVYAGSYSSHSTLSLGTSICSRCSPGREGEVKAGNFTFEQSGAGEQKGAALESCVLESRPARKGNLKTNPML